MPKVLLTRSQTVDHVFHREGERDVTDKVATELKKRGALGELPADAKKDKKEVTK